MLTYNGDGSQHVTGIPARDLTEDELNMIARRYELPTGALIAQLTAQGLYSVVTPPHAVIKDEKPIEEGE